MRPLAAAALLALGCHAQLDARPDSSTGDLVSAFAVNLLGAWDFVSDAQTSSDPTATVTANSEASVSVAYQAVAGGCGCSARRLWVQLPREFACSSTTMSFTWATTGTFDGTDSTSLRVEFGGGSLNRFVASTWSGHSNCANLFGNQFPSPPRIVPGENRIDLAQLDAATDGRCADFSTMEIHVEGYACFNALTATLSDFVLQ